MANQLYKNFPEIQYKLSNGKIVTVKDFFRKAKLEGNQLEQLIDYTFYEIQEGERPDVIASKLYGDGDLHWTIFLANEITNYYDWYMDTPTFENYMKSTPRLIPNIFKYKRPETGEKVLVKISRINGVLIEVIGYLFLYTLIDIIYFILD